jgi:hypothetical protein
VPHVARAARRDPESRELVVAPERPVDQHHIAGREPREHALVQAREAGDVAEHAAARAVAEDEAARLQLDVRVARCVATDRERLDCEARPVERPLPLRLERLPLGAAVALQDRQHGIAAPQRALYAGLAEDAHRSGRLAQQQKPRGVIDLRIGQQHPGDRRRADAVDRLRCERLELLTRVRRGVDEVPRPLVAADRQ